MSLVHAHRIVFFGMNGPLSRVPLNRLVTSPLKPLLVIEGLSAPDPKTSRRPQYHFERGRSRPWASATSSPPIDIARSTSSGASPLSLREIALGSGIDFICTSDANGARVRARIRAANADALLVAGFPHLLSADVLALSKKGGLNVHPGALPEERGPAPVFWALKRGQTRFTYTIHMLDVGEDTGDIITSGMTDECDGLAMSTILEQIAKRATPSLIQGARALLEGDLVRHRQPVNTEATSRAAIDAKAATTAPSRRPRPAFRDGLIDRTRPAKEVFTFVRGCAETHSLFVESGGDRFFIRSAYRYDETGTLGFDYVLLGDHLYVRCDPGFVDLELKAEGALFGSEYTTPTGGVL
ncbi:MAG: hypothetical protein H6729_10605 [Deltaproteobacteria bacterium]|nr:hypothetical protein [Deltaproteobacteria bacterium]